MCSAIGDNMNFGHRLFCAQDIRIMRLPALDDFDFL
jgi:hypothetical protein